MAKKATYKKQKAIYIAQLCQATIETDKGIKRLCDTFRANDPGFPAARTIREWIADDEQFSAQYARAKELQVDFLVEQIVEIADDSSEDEIFISADDESGESGKRVMNSEFVQRSKLRVDARKWVASKLAPKKYGDKIEQKIEHSGTIDGPVLNLVLNGVKDGS